MDVFHSTEVQLARAKRQFSELEKRLDAERTEFTKDYRRINEQLLEQREKSAGLQARIFDLETDLHKERLSKYSIEEELTAKNKAIDEELKKYRTKYEAHVSALETELKDTKETWSTRLYDEKKAWTTKSAEKQASLESQITQTRDYYKTQVDGLHKELSELLNSHRSLKSEVELSQSQLRDEKRKKKVLKMELEEAKEKYRRCLGLASDLVALRKSRPQGSVSEFASAKPWTSYGVSAAGKSSADDSSLIKKQLNLTQVLLEDEIKKNSYLKAECDKYKYGYRL